MLLYRKASTGSCRELRLQFPSSRSKSGTSGSRAGRRRGGDGVVPPRAVSSPVSFGPRARAWPQAFRALLGLEDLVEEVGCSDTRSRLRERRRSWRTRTHALILRPRGEKNVPLGPPPRGPARSRPRRGAHRAARVVAAHALRARATRWEHVRAHLRAWRVAGARATQRAPRVAPSLHSARRTLRLPQAILEEAPRPVGHLAPRLAS